jgi:hypothetical protein
MVEKVDHGIDKIFRASGDILTIMNFTLKLGWNEIRELSIYRILYLSSVLYSFKYPERRNPFIDDYSFIVSLRGPYSEVIEKSLIYLLTNHYIKKVCTNNDQYILDVNKNELTYMPGYQEKNEWLEIIIYILGVYGEDKIYDFIFRDPEYQDSIARNSQKELNLTPSNQTHQTLMKFKELFEKAMNEENDVIELDDKAYLNMYFEYVFSKILKGEGEDGTTES